MPISPEIAALIERLNLELTQIEQEVTEGLILARSILNQFPNNAILIQMFALLNNAIFFVDTQRRRIQTIAEEMSQVDLTHSEQLQETLEELSYELGRIIETKTTVRNIRIRLQRLS